MNNERIVFTSGDCIGCNKCISGCPVPGANIAHNHRGKNIVTVDGTKCIHCGRCIITCGHMSREYSDDTEKFFEDLHQGENISVVVDPAFYLNYGDDAPVILEYLKKLGVEKIYNLSVGYDIALWAYCKWLTDNPSSGGIIPSCYLNTEFIQHLCPELLDSIIPVKTPLMCLATYVRKYLGATEKLAYISPCVSVHDVITAPENAGMVSYNITFSHLMMKLNARKLEQEKEKFDRFSFEPDLPDYGMGSLSTFPGVIKEQLLLLLGRNRNIVSVSNVNNLRKIVDLYISVNESNSTPFIVDTVFCEHGCSMGAGTDFAKNDFPYVLRKFNELHSDLDNHYDPDWPFIESFHPEERLLIFNKHFIELKFEDFYHSYQEKYVQPFSVPHDTVEEIFNSMHMTTPETRHIDCGACGYSSCKEMAEAVANGYNEITNCSYYDKIENRKLITTNSVTGLPNSGEFHRVLQNMIESNMLQGFTVLQYNIKGFMLINKRYGFKKGSKILCEYARYMESKLIPREHLFHTGGDNFVAIVKNQRVNLIIFEYNHAQLRSILEEDPNYPPLQIYCGVYQLTGKETETDNIVNPANAAYMLAKRSANKDIVFYDDHLATSMVNSMLIAKQMPAALKNEELFCVLQPKVSIGGRKLIGAEALVRWKHNDKIVPPGIFLPECEVNGFIKQIDIYILNHVCKKIADWHHAGLECVPVSVNFSKLHFLKEFVAEEIIGIVDAWKVPHEYIEIECTETAFIGSKDNLQKCVDELTAAGIKTSIDDFGTGYSSLSMLQDFRFSVLKFDKTFIDTVQGGSRAELIVRDIVKMAKDLEMKIVAEGVETPDKLKLIGDIGIDYVQGYIYDKPLSVEEFEDRLRNKIYAERK